MRPLLLLLGAGACAREVRTVPPGAPPARLRFVAAPTDNQPGGTVLARATYAGQPLDLHWYPLLLEGTSYGGLPFGTVLNSAGKPEGDAQHPICPAPDYNGLLQMGDAIWLYTHLECVPAGLQRTRLERIPDAGFRVVDSRLADQTPPEGMTNLCSGSVTPWGTVLSAEEYEPNAALLANGKVENPVPGKADGKKYADWSAYPRAVAALAGTQPASPYLWGWIPETRPDAQGTSTTVKHHAMGRFSHELAVVAPDQRTVYLSDDNAGHGMLGMFVADKAGDLSAGTLYAARLSAAGDGHAVSWVSLGHATDAEIGEAIADGVAFTDLFDRAPGAADTCPAGLSPHRDPQVIDECLRVKPGKALLASRLETRRAASLLGATTELSKEEGLAFDAANHVLYSSVTRILGGMLAGDPPIPGRDHLAFAPNPCGAILAYDLGAGQTDDQGQPIDSAWVAHHTRVAVAGVPEGEGCATTSFSEPDNLAFIPEAGVLLIAEDTGRAPNRLWAWQDGSLVPIFSAPWSPGKEPAEVSGLSWVSDVGGAGWITVSAQDPDGQPAVMGVLGPFPVMGR